jgi:preprotein translocase subunit SecE
MANPFRKIRVFWGETLSELKKAAWPTRQELKANTLVVLVAIVLVGGFIALADFSVYNWVQFLTNLVRPGQAG